VPLSPPPRRCAAAEILRHPDLALAPRLAACARPDLTCATHYTTRTRAPVVADVSLQSFVSEYECIANIARAIHSGAWKLHCFTVITPTDRCIPPLIIDHDPGDIIPYCCTDGICRGLILKWVYSIHVCMKIANLGPRLGRSTRCASNSC
jgi:hypothetical protein